MADAQYQFEVAMGLNQASANRTVAQAARAAQEIAEATQAALGRASASALVANPADAARFAAVYGRAMQDAMRDAVRALPPGGGGVPPLPPGGGSGGGPGNSIVPRPSTTLVTPGRGGEQAFPANNFQGFYRAEQVFNRVAQLGQALGASSQDVTNAQRRVAELMNREAAAAQLGPSGGGGGSVGGGGGSFSGGASGGGGGGFFGNFATGFKGRSERPFAEQLGQAFKFSVFYGTAYRLLSGITVAFQQSLQEGIQFQQAVSEMRLATGQSAESATALANQLGKEAAQYGFSPSEGALIGARAQGIYGTAGLSQTAANKAIQDRVAKESTRVVSQLAFASGQQPADIQANLGAVAQAYGLGPNSQQYLGDLDAYFSRRFGAAPGSTIAATSQAATVGRAAGFSAAEVSAIAADIMARTGATADSTGGYLAQIFSRSGEGSLNTLLANNNISTSGTLQQQLAALAQVYKQDPSQRDDISAAFGRGKVQNAVIALLQDYAEVQGSVNDQGKATGSLDKATALRLDNVGGQAQQLVGELRELANQIGQSGLLDAVGGAVLAFKNIVEIANDFLEVFNQLPRGLRDAILALGVFTAATRVAAGSEGVQAAGGVLPYLTRGGLTRAAGPLTQAEAAAGITAGQRVVATRAGTIVPLASRAGVGAAAGAALTSTAGAAVLIAGSAVTVAKAYEVAKRFDKARTDYLDFAASRDFDLTTGEGNRAAASAASQLATEQKDAARPGGFSGLLARTSGDDQAALERYRRAKDDAAFFNAQAKLLEDNEANGGVVSGNSGRAALVADPFSDTGITNAFNAIALQGGTATQQLNALAASILHTGDASKRAVENYDPKIAASGAGTKALDQFLAYPGFVAGTVQRLAPGARVASPPIDVNAIPSNRQGFTDNTSEVASKLFTPKQITDRFEKGLGLIKSIDELSDPKTYNRVLQTIVSDLPERAGKREGLDDTQIAGIRDKFVKRAKNQLDSLLASSGNIDNLVELTGTQLTLFTQTIASKVGDELGQKDEVDFRGRDNILARRIRDVRQAIRQTPTGVTNQSRRDLQNLLNQQAENQYNQLEGMKEVAQSNATNDAQFASIGRRFTGREIRGAVRRGSADTLAKVISANGKYARDVAVKAINDAQKTAIAAAEAEAQLAAVQQAISTGQNFFGALINGGDLSTDALRQVTAPFRKLRRALNQTASAKPEDAGGVTGDTAAQISAARAAAEAARRGGDLAAATSAIAQAKADLADAKKGSVAFYQAQAALYQAQQQYTQALIAYHQNQFLLGHDATNPLVQDRAATQAAAAQLRADRARGAGADVLAQDRVSLQSAQASQESTAFSQRLEAVQTADDLGRISHSKYLSYLQHEHDRLEGIKNRTFQQQQQLNQIDQLMKQAADEMSGQFNFGDIKLPSPYEVRRKIAEEAAAVKNPAGQRSPDPTLGGIGGPLLANVPSTTYITIDGADTAKVKAILTDVLGKRATTTTTSPRHR